MLLDLDLQELLLRRGQAAGKARVLSMFVDVEDERLDTTRESRRVE